ncbi:MAG TPA: cytochrome-c oxidase, cbb3-type subunit II [Oscillatoriaceae cyanobacterium]
MSHPLNERHSRLEKRPIWFLLFVTVAVSIGGLVEIVPIVTAQPAGHASTLEAQAAALVKPRTPLQQEGMDIYVREGCYLCHSQMVRPFRWETLRFGAYSLAAEAQYDHPFQYGSRRIGPDLARVGGKYPDAWHVQHMRDPRSVVPTSLMPAYPWLEKTKLDGSDIQAKMRALREVGVPYTDQQIADAPKQLLDKTELDALVAYLQSLGQATKNLQH